MRVCPRKGCGEKNAPSAEHCQACGYQLVLTLKAPPKPQSRPRVLPAAGPPQPRSDQIAPWLPRSVGAGDPKPRADGLCANPKCRKPRRKPPSGETQRSKTALALDLAKDPFCSSTCARKHYGVPIWEAQPRKAHSEEPAR